MSKRKGKHIEGDLYLDSDDFQFILKRYTNKFDKKGNEVAENISYHNSIEGIAKKIYMLKIKKSTAKTIQELVDDHKQIMKEIRETFKLKGLID